MATTTKTLTPTNQTVTLPDMTERPNASVLVDGIGKEADAINALSEQITNKAGTGTLSNIHTDVSINKFEYVENDIMAQVYIQFTVSAQIAGWVTIFELPFKPKEDLNIVLINSQQIFARTNKEVRTNKALNEGTYYASFIVLKE